MTIHGVINELVVDEKSRSLFDSFYSSKLERGILVIIGVLIITGVCLSFFEKTQNLVGYAVLIVFGLFFLFSMLSFLSQVRFMLSPSENYVIDLSRRIEGERSLIARLSTFDYWSLKKARERLEYEAKRLDKRVGAFVGALDKLGMIPAILGLYVAYSKLFGESIFTEVPYFILGLFAGAYLAAFSAVHIISRLTTMAYVVGVAEELALQADEVQEVHISNK